MTHRLLAAIFAICLASIAGAQSSIQSVFPTVFPKSVLLIDPDMFLRGSELGQVLLQSIDDQSAARVDENKAIAAELEAEEARLTELRPTIDPAEFLILSNAFDGKVQTIRDEQIAKDVALQREAERVSPRFIAIAAPILNQLLIKYQAGAIIDRRATVLYNTDLDITAEAITLLNQTFAENPDILEEK